MRLGLAQATQAGPPGRATQFPSRNRPRRSAAAVRARPFKARELEVGRVRPHRAVGPTQCHDSDSRSRLPRPSWARAPGVTVTVPSRDAVRLGESAAGGSPRLRVTVSRVGPAGARPGPAGCPPWPAVYGRRLGFRWPRRASSGHTPVAEKFIGFRFNTTNQVPRCAATWAYGVQGVYVAGPAGLLS